MKLYCTAVLMVLLVGCGTASRVVRLDTGQTDTLVFTPRSSAEPVALGNSEFEKAMSALAREVRPSIRPQEAARRLFEVEARSGSYTYEVRSRRITPLKPGEHLEGQSTTEDMELTRAYLRWCERTGRPGDCLRLLTESPTLNGEGRFALAMALTKGVVLDEMMEAFKDMAGPHAMVATVLWTWTTYMILVSIPDVTVSKGLAAIMTATLISYVGVDTFWGLVVGFKRLMDEADRATSFNELRAAGERYGKLMGRNAARAFAMLAMAAIGNTAPGLAAKVPKLPGSMQAAVQAETQVGIRLAAVGEVTTVAVSAETVTIALAPGAVAMTSSGTSGGGTPKGDDLEQVNTRWHEGSYDSPSKSLQTHFNKHGAEVDAKDVAQYLRKALEFAQRLKGAQKFPVEGATDGVIRYVKNGRYIDLAPDGRILSFGSRQDKPEGRNQMNWRAINLHGAASISRVVNVFEIRDMRGIPWTKYKIKVLEEVSGSFLAVANVCVKNANGTPDGEAGLGRTEVEALQDLITRLGERLNSRKDWRDEDFEWTDPQDF